MFFAFSRISTDVAGSTTLGGNVRTTGAISFRDPTNAANRTLASVNNAGVRINVMNLASSPNAIDTSGAVTLDGTALGDSGGSEIDFVCAEANRLRLRYPKIAVAPMLYKVEDNRLYLIEE